MRKKILRPYPISSTIESEHYETILLESIEQSKSVSDIVREALANEVIRIKENC